MKEAAVPGYRLSRAKTSTKILTTLGLIGLFLGLLAATFMTLAKTGITQQSVSSYYLGQAPASESLDSELDAELGEMLHQSSPRPFAELMEVTHMHLLGGSMLLFFLCHLLSVCDVSDTLRSTVYIVSFVSFLVTFTLPWLIVYASPVFSYMFGPAIVTFLISLVALCAIPLQELWFCKNANVVVTSKSRSSLSIVNG